MELWKFILLYFMALIAKSVGLVWALNELFNVGIEYSFLTIVASAIILFCFNGSLPFSTSASRDNKRVKAAEKSVK